MGLSERTLSGRDYLDAVTHLLQRARNASPLGGQWEAADFQWWWRRDQHATTERQRFWFDDEGPAAAVVITDWGGGRHQCDLLTPAHDLAPFVELLWPVALQMIDGLPMVEVPLREDDRTVMASPLEQAGFEPTGETWSMSWMNSSHAGQPYPLPDGYHIVDRLGRATERHPLALRNGADIADRLAECSLYDPSLDLSVIGPDRDVAGYAVMWADPATKVGLIETRSC